MTRSTATTARGAAQRSRVTRRDAEEEEGEDDKVQDNGRTRRGLRTAASAITAQQEDDADDWDLDLSASFTGSASIPPVATTTEEVNPFQRPAQAKPQRTSAYELPINPLDTSALDAKRRISMGLGRTHEPQAPAAPAQAIDEENPFQSAVATARQASPLRVRSSLATAPLASETIVSSNASSSSTTTSPPVRDSIYTRFRRFIDEKTSSTPSTTAATSTSSSHQSQQQQQRASAWELPTNHKMHLLNIPAPAPEPLRPPKSPRSVEHAARTTASSLNMFFQMKPPVLSSSSRTTSAPRGSLHTTTSQQQRRSSFGASSSMLSSILGEDPENDAHLSDADEDEDGETVKEEQQIHRYSFLSSRRSLGSGHDVDQPTRGQPQRVSSAGARATSRTRTSLGAQKPRFEEEEEDEEPSPATAQTTLAGTVATQPNPTTSKLISLAAIVALLSVCGALLYYLFRTPMAIYCDSETTRPSLAQALTSHPEALAQPQFPSSVPLNTACVKCPAFAVCRGGQLVCPSPLVPQFKTVPIVNQLGQGVGEVTVAACSPDVLFETVATAAHLQAGGYECAALTLEDFAEYRQQLEEAVSSLPLLLQPFGHLLQFAVLSPVLSGAEYLASFVVPAVRDENIPRQPYLTRRGLETIVESKLGTPPQEAEAAVSLVFKYLTESSLTRAREQFPHLAHLTVDRKHSDRVLSTTPRRSLLCSIRSSLMSPSSLVFMLILLLGLRAYVVAKRRHSTATRQAELKAEIIKKIVQRLEDAYHDQLTASDELEELRDERAEVQRLRAEQPPTRNVGLFQSPNVNDVRISQLDRMIQDTAAKLATARKRVYYPVQLAKKELFDVHGYNTQNPGLWSEICREIDTRQDISLVRRPADGAPSWVLRECLQSQVLDLSFMGLGSPDPSSRPSIGSASVGSRPSLGPQEALSGLSSSSSLYPEAAAAASSNPGVSPLNVPNNNSAQVQDHRQPGFFSRILHRWLPRISQTRGEPEHDPHEVIPPDNAYVSLSPPPEYGAVEPYQHNDMPPPPYEG